MISMESGVTELITSCNNTDNQTSIKNINSTSINNHNLVNINVANANNAANNENMAMAGRRRRVERGNMTLLEQEALNNPEVE